MQEITSEKEVMEGENCLFCLCNNNNYQMLLVCLLLLLSLSASVKCGFMLFSFHVLTSCITSCTTSVSAAAAAAFVVQATIVLFVSRSFCCYCYCLLIQLVTM